MNGAFRGGFSAFCGSAATVDAVVEGEGDEAKFGLLNGTATKFVSAIADVTAATPNDALYDQEGEGRHISDEGRGHRKRKIQH